MLRAYPLILTCLFLSFASQAEAAEAQPAPPASQTRASSTPSPQDLESIFTMAEQGDAGSQNYLGFLYATGQTVAKDEKAAFIWFKKAADKGYPEALGNLAMMYEKGLGVGKDLRIALALHRQAAMAGYPISMKRLASLYETGFMGEERDPIKAEMWRSRYKETLKTGAPAASDAAPRQAAEKAPVTAQAEKPSAPKPVASWINTPPQVISPPVPDEAQNKPVAPASSNKATAAAKPYFIQIGGKATARETMEVTQKIVEKNLLPQNKKIELVNPDGKSYRINIGPFADAHQAAPYKARIMALLNTDPIPTPEPAQATPAAAVAAPRPPVQAALTQTAATSPKAVPAMAAPPQAPATHPLPTTSRPAEKPIAAAQAARQPAPPPPVAIPASPPAKAEDGDKGKNHYIEISGRTTAREATQLVQKIVEKGMLPKNMHVEFVNPDADNYRIRIGPFADAGDAAPQIAQINATLKSASAPASPPPTDTGQELVPVASARKHPVSAAIASPPVAPAQPTTPPVTALKVAAAPAAGNTPAKQAEETGSAKMGGLSPTPQKSAAAKAVRDRYYFVQMNTAISFEDGMFLTQFLLMKDLVQETHRVKIENLDGQSFRLSIGPFNNAKEAQLQLQKINRQTFQALSVVTLEKFAPTSGDSGHEPFIQINAKTTLDNALMLTQTLVEKKLLTANMVAEIVNFGASSYRVRFGPFKGTAGQNLQNLKKQLKVSPILVNLDRLVPAEGA